MVGRIDNDQGQAAGQKAGAETQHLHEHQHTHQTIDDAGDTGQGLGGELHHLDEGLAGGVLGQVDRRAHAQRQGDDQGQHNDVKGVEQVRQDADGVLNDTGFGGEKLPADVGDAPHKDVAQQSHQNGHGQEGAAVNQHLQHGCLCFTFCGMAHCFSPRFKKVLSSQLMSMMNTNRTRPMLNRACFCRLPSAA